LTPSEAESGMYSVELQCFVRLYSFLDMILPPEKLPVSGIRNYPGWTATLANLADCFGFSQDAGAVKKYPVTTHVQGVETRTKKKDGYANGRRHIPRSCSIGDAAMLQTTNISQLKVDSESPR